MGGASVALGLVVLTGWWTHTALLTQPVGSVGVTKPNTALCLVLLGVVVLGRALTGRVLAWDRLAAGAAVVVALATIGEYVTRTSFGIDELVSDDWRSSSGAIAGRMPLVTAVCLIGIGGALLTTARTRWLRSPLAMGAAVLGLLSLLGHLLSASELYRPVGSAAVAVATGVSLTALGLSVLALYPRPSTLDLWTGDGPGSIVLRRTLPELIGALVLAAWLRLEGQRHGWYDTELGLALMLIMAIAVLAVAIGSTAVSLERASRLQRQAESDAATAAADLQAVADGSSSLITMKTVDGTYVLANRAFTDLFAPTLGGVVGRADPTFLRADLAESQRELDEAVIESGAPSVSRLEIADGDGGDHRTFVCSRFLLRDGHEIRRLCMIATEVTALVVVEERERALEARAAAAQRFEAVGQLAGGISHDFNNLLNVIAVTAELLRAGVEPGSEAAADAEAILDAAQRGSALTRQLLAFSRREVGVPGVVDVGRLIVGMRDLLRRSLDASIELDIEDHGSAIAVIDHAQLESVVMNLAVNARHAMQSGGRLAFVVEVVELSGSELLDAVVPGSYVHLRASDTGSGMPDEVAASAFEPFFTTKPEGEGTGLGLATVYSIATTAGGSVRIESVPGEGTSIHVYLPLARETISATT